MSQSFDEEEEIVGVGDNEEAASQAATFAVPGSVRPPRTPLDDRARIAYLWGATVLVYVLALATLIWHHVYRPATEAAPAHPDTPRSIAVFLICAGVTLLLTSATLGTDWWRRIWGLGCLAIARLVSNQSLEAYADEFLRNPLRHVTDLHRLILRVGTALLMIGLVGLALGTGGLLVSPFLQFGASLFLIGMFLTDAPRGRFQLAGGAVATVTFTYVLRDHAQNVTVRPSWYFTLQLINLVLSLAVGIAGATNLKGRRQVLALSTAPAHSGDPRTALMTDPGTAEPSHE